MCGFIATTRDMLVFFHKKYDGTISDFCDICNVRRRYSLVKCKICGLKAYTQEDLRQFVTRIGTKHGRGLLCLKCQKRTNVKAYEKRRQRLLKILAEMAQDEYLVGCLRRSGYV